MRAPIAIDVSITENFKRMVTSGYRDGLENTDCGGFLDYARFAAQQWAECR